MVRELQTRLRQLEGQEHRPSPEVVGTGCADFDALWPAGGLERGTLIEWFPAPEAERGSGCATLALVAARCLAADGGALVVVDRAKTFYPPAALALGVAATSLIIVRPSTAADELWAIDQALRSTAVAAVWTQLEKISAHDFRRLQLAAEQSGAVGLLIRPARTRWQPSWAHVRIVCRPQGVGSLFRRAGGTAISSVTATGQRPVPLKPPIPSSRRLNIEVIRVRGGTLGAAGRSIELEMDDTSGELQPRAPHATHCLPVFSALAAAAAESSPA
jgi:hypothetical protein